MSYFSHIALNTIDSKKVFESIQEAQNSGNQSFVEWFSGDALDTIWTTVDLIGTATSEGMNDAVDGGYQITTNNSANSVQILTFNDKRQYNHDGSTFIGIIKAFSTASNVTTVGGTNNPTTAQDNFFHAGMNTAVGTNFMLRSGDDTTVTGTGGSVANDTNWHKHECSINATSMSYWTDESFEVLKTTNMPTAKLQPHFQQQQLGTPGGKQGAIRYLECWNH